MTEEMIEINTVGELNNYGVQVKDSGDWERSAEIFEQCIKEDPEFAAGWQNLGVVRQLQGHLDQAISHYAKAMELEPQHCVAHSNLIFLKDLMPEFNAQDVQAERRSWGNKHSVKRRKKTKIRVGYVGGDFSNHSAANCFGSMLTKYNRKEFEVYIYANQDPEKRDQVSQLFAESVDYFYFCHNWNDTALWGQIQWDEIDILVDLAAHSANNRLKVFSMRAAPIQVTAWGYALGTGLREMDYFFTDAVQVPEAEEAYYAEKIVRLPCVAGYWNHRSKFPNIKDVPDRPFTFGSFNRLSKHSAECLAVWREILSACPDSRLLFKTPELGTERSRTWLLKHFEGVEDRVEIRGATNWEIHLAAYNEVDLALDPWPHGGGVTTLEAMAMGVPVLTLDYPTVVGRLSKSMITTNQWGGYIVESAEKYKAQAITKCTGEPVSVDSRKFRKEKFIESILGDPVKYCRMVEGVYKQLLEAK